MKKATINGKTVTGWVSEDGTQFMASDGKIYQDFVLDQRGGARPGSGRRRKTEDGARVNFTAMIAPITRQRITALRAQGVGIGEALDGFIAQLAKQHGIK